ncbi:hypothetical protein [Pararhodobacter sp. SW119]|uniref:hypothetical protein n=1 Tax=Pararhodobacter sp. SW119 TaxID=2780075 RepID=UPI001AE07702|nr:hypothetical protein [Pararhodobacter sp. SW119]
MRDHEARDYRTRVQAFEEGLGRVAADNPEDMEVAILHALVTSANFDPADRTYVNQLLAAEILEPLLASHPDHPGVPHYLIHTYDYPPLAKQDLEAAGRYAEIAPGAVHALHMPSHTFTSRCSRCSLSHRRSQSDHSGTSAVRRGYPTHHQSQSVGH